MRDQRSVKKLRRLREAGRDRGVGSLSRDSGSRRRPDASLSNDNAIGNIDRRRLPRWASTGDILKAHVYNDTLRHFGKPGALSLNLSDDVIKRALKDKKQSFSAHILERVRKALRGSGLPGVEVWIIVEENADGRLHIHGGLAYRDEDLPAIKRSIKSVGGRWLGNRQGRQLDIRDQYRPAGWAKYLGKAQPRTRRRVKGRMIARTQQLDQRAKAAYEELRKRERELRTWRIAAAGASGEPRTAFLDGLCTLLGTTTSVRPPRPFARLPSRQGPR